MVKIFKNRRSKGNEKREETKPELPKNELERSLDENISCFKNIFRNDETLMIREFQNKHLKAAQGCVIYIEGMVNPEIINENIIEPVLSSNLAADIENNNLLEELRRKVIIANNVTAETEINNLLSAVIAGNTLFLLEGSKKALIISSKGWPARAITEPESAKVTRGPREGFTESIITNLALIRRKIANPDLKFRFKEIGERTHTKTCICYLFLL